MVVPCPTSPPEHQHTSLRASLSTLLLLDLQFKDLPVHLHLRLEGWCLSQPALAALPCAPQFSCISFTACQWPLPATGYSTLLTYLPRTFQDVWLHPGPTEQQLLSICLGAPRSRSQDWPLDVHMVVQAAAQELENDITDAMTEQGPYPYVSYGVQVMLAPAN